MRQGPPAHREFAPPRPHHCARNSSKRPFRCGYCSFGEHYLRFFIIVLHASQFCRQKRRLGNIACVSSNFVLWTIVQNVQKSPMIQYTSIQIPIILQEVYDAQPIAPPVEMVHWNCIISRPSQPVWLRVVLCRRKSRVARKAQSLPTAIVLYS